MMNEDTEQGKTTVCKIEWDNAKREDEGALPGRDTLTSVTNGATDGTKNNKRTRTSGVAERKIKKLNMKNSMPGPHLNPQAGQYWYARVRGHPLWPVIIRDVLQAGGKNARNKRYPVMFLGQNEL